MVRDPRPGNVRPFGWVELAVTWARLYAEPVLASYEVGVNDSLAGRIVWTDSVASGANLEFNWAHPLFDPLRRHQSSQSRPAPSHAAASHARETLDPSSDEWQVHRVELYGLTRLPDWDELLSFNVEDLATDREHGIESPGSLNLPRFRALVSGVFIGIGDTLRNELTRLRYIGPVRKLRPRVEAEPGSADQESWSDGSAAWSRLLAAPPDPSRPDLLKEVNDWLARNDRLDTGYKLRRRSTVELPAEQSLDLSNAKLVRLDGAVDYDDAIAPAEECWIRNAVAHQRSARAFHAILATRNPDDHSDVVLEEDVDASHAKLDVPREVPVLREPAALAAHVGTLVRNSRELLLIDPHFDPSVPKWRPVAEACIELVSQTAHENPTVAIHTLDADRKPSLDEFRRRCRRHIPNMMSGKVASIRVCRWRIRDGASHDFHGRYLLTDRGGYRLDKGLDAEHGMEQPVGLPDAREWKRLREGYGDANPFFEKADAFTLDRSGTLRPELPHDEPAIRAQ